MTQETGNLNDPAQARKYFDSLRYCGQRPEYLFLPGGKRLYFKDMTDEQIVAYAKELAPDLGRPPVRRGKPRLQ